MQGLIWTVSLVMVLVGLGTGSVGAQAGPPPSDSPAPQSAQTDQYSSNEVIDAGHRFFGTISRGLAEIVEKAGSQWGLPNGYILGQEAGGAWSPGFATGKASSTLKMLVTFGCIGKANVLSIGVVVIASTRPPPNRLLGLGQP